MEKYQEQIIDLLNASIHDSKPKFNYSNNIDWDKIIEECNAHSIDGLLYPALKNSGDNIDNKIINKLKKITKEIKNYLNQSETILQKKEILQNNQKEILTFLKKYEKIETCINECRNRKEHIEEQIRHYEELDHQEERKEELKEDCERAKKEADREQKNYENAWAEYEMKYHKFLNEQAGILALNLEDGQPCPVCGSREHPQIAALSDEAPTQAEVELAKAERDKKEKIRDIKTEAFRKCLAGYQAAQEICLTLRKNIKDDAEDITGIGWKEKIQSLKRTLMETEKRLKQLEEIFERCRTLKEDQEQIADQIEKLEEILLSLSEHVTYRLRKYKMKAKVVNIQLRTKDFIDSSHQEKLEYPTASTKEIYKKAKNLLISMYKPYTPIRLIGLRVEGLEENEMQQTTLFEPWDNEKQEKLDKVVDELKIKYGYNFITRAGRLDVKDLKFKGKE